MFVNGEKIAEISGTMEEAVTETVLLSHKPFDLGIVYVQWFRLIRRSYPLKIFIASRRAVPIQLTITSNCEELCSNASFQEAFRVSDAVPNNGQLTFSVRVVRHG